MTLVGEMRTSFLPPGRQIDCKCFRASPPAGACNATSATATNHLKGSIMPALVEATKGAVESLLPELEAIYKDLHEHPELSMQEVRTARIAADYL